MYILFCLRKGKGEAFNETHERVWHKLIYNIFE